MNRSRQLRLGLFPTPNAVILPAEVLELVLEGVAELLLQVHRAESSSPVATDNVT